MKILLFGGTTEGRILAEKLMEQGHAVTVSVATNLGAEDLSGVDVRIGRLEYEEMAAILPAFDLCIDATHPYAKRISETVRSACQTTSVPLRRVLRPQSQSFGGVPVESCAAAAAYLAGTEGNILLTTGTKDLHCFSLLPTERLFARVLPTRDAISSCEAVGLPHRNILALWGPFSLELNAAILRQYHIRWMVTKESGKQGGFREKMEAARQVGAEVLVVRRPEDRGVTWEDLLTELEKGGDAWLR